jgi:uncharacterized membrane protein
MGDERLAHAVNQLLVIGFYVINLGYVSFFMSSDRTTETGQSVMELLSTKIGGVALIVGGVHFGNVWLLNTYRRRALLRAAGDPPVAPSGRTEIAPA